MTRSKFSIKAALLAGGIGLSMPGFAGSQPAAAQSLSDQYSCPAGYVYDPTYGCTVPDGAYEPYDYGYYGYCPTAPMDPTMLATTASPTVRVPASIPAQASPFCGGPHRRVYPASAVTVSTMLWPAVSATSTTA